MTRIGSLFCAMTFISFALFSGNALAEVYKWVDANGKVHYSDRKVDAAAVKLDVSTGAATLGQSDQNVQQRLVQQNKYLNYLTTERQEREEKRAELKQQKATQKKYCTAIKDQLRSFTEDNSRWYDFDEESGERRYLSDAEIDKQIQELQAEIKTSC